MESLPTSAADLTPQLLTSMVSKVYPNTTVEDIRLIKAHEYGDGDVSTSARATVDLTYGAGAPPGLPARVVIKMSFDDRKFDDDPWFCKLSGLFENEVHFYNRIRPHLKIEAPLSLGGFYEQKTNRFVLILEDLRRRNVHFPTVMSDLAVEQVQSVLAALARLHATFWNSERFKGDLSWVETHLQGRVESHMRGIIPEGVRDQLAKHKFKREVLERLGTTEAELFAGMCAVKQYQSSLSQTLLHGDCHVGNTYQLPDGTVGFVDWQLCVRGFPMHDVSYVLNTSLSIGQRRKHERELLAYYRDSLRSFGVKDPPDQETLWREHRLATLWTVYIGWLTCPMENYGWETVVVALLKVSTAFEDLETRKAIAGLL